MHPIAIHHVSINVNDVDEGVTFYTGLLGGSSRDDRPDFGFDGAWIDFGAQQVHLIQGAVPPDCGQHFAIWVADHDAAVLELRARGVAVSDPVPVGKNRQSFVEDPSGNLVELHEVSEQGRTRR